MRKTEIARMVLYHDLINIVGTGRSTASLISHGKNKPSLAAAILIDEKIGIPPNAWAKGTYLDEMWRVMTSPDYPPTEEGLPDGQGQEDPRD